MATKSTNSKTAAKKSSAKPTARKASKAVDNVKTEVTDQANSVLNTLNSNFKNAQNFGQRVWFAGLGVVGRSVEEVQERVNTTNEELRTRYTKINQDGQQLVDDLVARGEKVQDDAEVLLKESRANIEEQIEVAKNRFGGLVSVVDIPARLKDMSDKLDSLSKDLKKSA